MFDTDQVKNGPDCGATPTRRTLSCFLCGGAHIYPGPRFENHLMNEHGAVFDLDFIVKISLYKQEHGNLPSFDMSASLNGHSPPSKAKVPTSEIEVQTDSDLVDDQSCSKCKGHSTLNQANGLKGLGSKDSKLKGNEESNFHSLRISNVSSLDESNAMDEDDFQNEDDYLNEDEEEADDDLSTHGFMGVDPKDFLGNQLIHEDDSQLSGLSPSLDDESFVTCWQCPECAKLYQRHSSFKQHACAAHDMTQDDIMSVAAIQLPEGDFKLKQAELQDRPSTSTPKPTSSSFVMNGGGRLSEENRQPIKTFPLDKSKRKPIGKEWAPNSFSSTFTCFFCNEQFRKDYKLKLHLMLNHKNESPKDMAKAKEELTKSKLDGCVHKCALCGSKYNSVANFTRHIKDVHNMSRAMYREDYGSSEVVSRMFKCELCEKEVKHTRNIIGAHMKMVHLISWREYQEILVKIRQGESVGDLPAPELFDCVICGVSVKYKREHLNKKHQITEDVYDELILKKSRGEDISDSLPTRELVRCLICDRECLDFKKHIERSHQITEDMYEEIITSRGLEDQRRSISQFEETLTSSVKGGKANGSSKSTPKSGKKVSSESSLVSVRSDSPSGISTSGNGSHLSTDLQCYFGCDEVFKKDYQLYLHLKLKHRHETADEIARAYEAADEEIALTKRSGSVFQCALCPKQFNDNGAFYSHIQSKHDMQWRDYKIRHGRCEVESSPFECKICSRVIKYDRNTIHTHLKNVHGINWTIYLDRLRKMRRGEQPDDLPQIEMIECRVCNVQVKYLKDHLKNAHKITEQEYESLFEGEHDLFSNNNGQTTNETQVTQPLSAQPISSSGLNLLPSQPVAIPKPPKSDIQNKTNKNCTSCNITFETRRSFIEHCTTVHSMKFKTKSGITISAPTLQQSLKRKLEAQNGIEHTGTRTEDNNMGAKRTKSSNIIEDDLPGNQGTQYTPNGVSKWNQCVYQCCFCGKSTQSRSSMTSHIHNSHGIPIKDYKEKNYPDIEVETRWFQCRLCTARTKFVKDCIAPHLKMSHNMEIEFYEKNFMKTEDWPSKTSPVSSLKSENKLVASSPASPQLKASKVLSNPSVASTSSSSQKSGSANSLLNSKADKWNRCKFKCAICAWVNVDSRQMRAHIATKHHMNYEKYVRSHGTAETVTMKFRCDLCHSEMKHCRQNIYAHMKDVHKITLDEYEERIGGYDSSYAQEVSAADSQAFDTPFFNQPEILVDNGNQPSRWNKCRFQCALCQKLSSEKRHIRDHIVKAHGMAMTDYENTYGDCEIHTEYFFCAVCHTEVKHNLKNISLHLQNVHSLSPQDYEDKYGRISDEEIVPALLPVEVNEEQLGGFGSHFLLEENGSSADETSQQTKAKRSRPSAKVPGGLPCDYCGKVFSNRSNCNRHMILSCEARKVNPDGSAVITTDKNGDQMEYNDNEEDEDEDEGSEQEKASPENGNDAGEKCPYPDCDETYARSALLKRHLFEAHNIQNISVQLPDLENEKRHFDRIKSEPKDSEEDRKVPPLRVKLTTGIASPTPGSSNDKPLTPSSSGSRSTLKEAQSCQYCSYKNSNLYILGRHQKACLKRQKSSSDMENDEEEKIEPEPCQPERRKSEESENSKVKDENNANVNSSPALLRKGSECEEQAHVEEKVDLKSSGDVLSQEPNSGITDSTIKGSTPPDNVPDVEDQTSEGNESSHDSEVETLSQITASSEDDKDGSQEKSDSTSEESETSSSSNKSETEANSSKSSTESSTLVAKTTSIPVDDTTTKEEKELSLTVKGISLPDEAEPEIQSTT